MLNRCERLNGKAIDAMIFGQGMGNGIIKRKKAEHVETMNPVDYYLGCPNTKYTKLRETYGIDDIKDCTECMIYGDNIFHGLRSDDTCERCKKKLLVNRIYR